jgi:hypothetical protein
MVLRNAAVALGPTFLVRRALGLELYYVDPGEMEEFIAYPNRRLPDRRAQG